MTPEKIAMLCRLSTGTPEVGNPAGLRARDRLIRDEIVRATAVSFRFSEAEAVWFLDHGKDARQPPAKAGD